jgi:hypothetical protein
MNQFTPKPFLAPTQQAAGAAGGVPVTPGTGPKIATDKVGELEYQTIKLALGGPGSAMLIEPGQRTAAESIPVVLASDSGEINVDFPPGMATEATLLTVSLEATQAVLAKLTTIDGHVDGLEAGHSRERFADCDPGSWTVWQLGRRLRTSPAGHQDEHRLRRCCSASYSSSYVRGGR